MSLASDLRFAFDRVAFAEDVLGLTLDSWQRDVLERDSKRDLLNCLRQAGKSTIAAVLGLHTSLCVPKSLTLLVSPSQRQSSELFRKVKEFAAMLPRQPDLLEDNKLSWTVRNGGRVAALPGSDATIRGFSAPTPIVEDEAAFVEDDTHAAMRPMLAVSNGRRILMSTPWGKRGHFWELWSEGHGWARTEVPATQVPLTDEIRRAVRVELAKRDHSQADLARELGMAPQYLSDIMRGKVSKMPGAWQRILDALDLELVAVPKEH